MIGKEYLFRLNQALNEATPSGSWVDKKTSFDYLYEAAKDFVRDSKSLHSSQTISTVSGTTSYDLNPDFLEVFSTKGFRDEDKVIKYYDGSNYYWPTWRPYAETFYHNDTTSVSIPNNFSIIDSTPETRLTGSAGGNSTNSGGETTLTIADTSSCYAGDSVMNTTSGYIGIVLAVASSTTLTTAMFDVSSRSSSYADWTSGNGYLIQPRSRFKLVLDPPPLTTGHVITIPYLQLPTPVYSDYGSYSFAVGYEEALIAYATWKYKYRDTSRANKEDNLFKMYDAMVRKAKNNFNVMTGRRSIQVSWKA